MVLAVLAANAGRPVSATALIDRVWGDRPPAKAREALYAYISRLRRLLGSSADSQTIDAPLVRRAGGYVLDIDAALIDLHRFRHLVAASRVENAPEQQRAKLLREALDMWSETPLAGLPGEWINRIRGSWEQERLDAAVQWANLELRLGRAADVIGPLRDLLRECPIAEPVAEALMRALATAGREAEAMDYYSSLRAQVLDDLGVEPGSQLRATHQALLRDELGGRAPAPPAAVTHPVPAQLPADVTAFTGRKAELAVLDRLLDCQATRPDTVPPLAVISGDAGVGKSTVALQWAHRVKSQFPDGQLYVNLRGDDRLTSLAPGKVLRRFLAALGLPSPEAGSDEEDLAARYRSALAGRRILVVLDNAAAAEQVRPLLPGTTSCIVIVTSRAALVQLVAGHGALRLHLDQLTMTDSVELLKRLIGAPVDVDPAGAMALAGQCSFLPPALRVVADLVTTGAATSLAQLATDLADPRRRGDLLDESCLRQMPVDGVALTRIDTAATRTALAGAPVASG